MDDFFDDVKALGGKVYSGIKKFYEENKPMVHDLMAGLATSAFP